MTRIFVSIVGFLVIQESVIGYRILGVFQPPSKSHYIVGHALMKGLADDGHDVTIISAYKQSKPINNYTEIYLEHSLDNAIKDVRSDNFLNYNNLHSWTQAHNVFDCSRKFVESAAKSENLRKFLRKKQHFDVVIFEIFVCDAFIATGHYFKAPLIGFSTIGPSIWTSDLVGLKLSASYIPNVSNGYTDRMSFWQRMYNSIGLWYEEIATPIFNDRIQDKLKEKIFPNGKELPSIAELRRNVSLVFTNSHVTYGIPQPFAPNQIEIGGIHINPEPDPLPKDIQLFLDEARNGVIYFSLGSNILMSKLPAKTKRIFANAFSSYPNVRLLIKTEDNFTIPSHHMNDVLIRPWFNQESILAHPNIKLFITHGGLLSTTEAVHFGKPVIGITVFFDQSLNMGLAEQKGYGIRIPYEHLTGPKLKLAIRKIFTDQSYTRNAQIISERYRDQIKSPMETAIHWVKHVAKNKGAPHLRSAAIDLPFYIYYNLDVWAFIVCTISAVAWTVQRTLKFLWSSIKLHDMTKKKNQ